MAERQGHADGGPNRAETALGSITRSNEFMKELREGVEKDKEWFLTHYHYFGSHEKKNYLVYFHFIKCKNMHKRLCKSQIYFYHTKIVT